MSARALTDFFGTRLEHGALAVALRALGFARFSLIVHDSGVILRLPRALDRASVGRAATWLRGVFSPLTSCRVQRSAARLDGRVVDRRRARTAVVALAEVFEEGGLVQAEAGLLRRLRGEAGGVPRLLRRARPGAERGVRPATILAASRSPAALTWLARAFDGEDAVAPFEVLLDGLEWGVARRPTIAVPALKGAPAIVADSTRCDGCGLCAAVCPARCLVSGGAFAPGAESRCLGCFDCVEACPMDALRPSYSSSSATTSRALARRPGWLARLGGAPGPALPAPFPPSYFLPKPDTACPPRWILGLSVMTMQEHAAALLDGGKVVGAVEEERLSRVRHHGWNSSLRPGSTLASDPTLCLEEVLCRRAIGALLSPRGLTLDDMDAVAVNGLPARYRRAYSTLGGGALPTLRAGRVVFLPHHLCHAASAWRVSGQRRSWILTVDGRGDRETAVVFKAERGRIEPVAELPSLADQSIGGTYESAARLLGFGAHGQGSVMALAAFGKPSLDLSHVLSLRSLSDHAISERELGRLFAALSRGPGDPLLRAHQDLAASVQAALENVTLSLLRAAGVERGAPGLCLAGGVALNGRMNEALRRALRPRAFFVQPAANDAGTALGAALEAAAGLGLPAVTPLSHAALGPGFTEGEAEAALEHAGLRWRRSSDLARETAALLARGEIVCWVQGRAEFGPRALGGRSVLADPRSAPMSARVNRMKDREAWRPFGLSILAGREGEWFEDACDSRFMLLTPRLKPERARLVPAVAHIDGTSRPQSVHRAAAPLFHALLSAFDAITGVPMLLNTSFNRRGEPIVCGPDHAVACFLGMPDAGTLVLGPFIARRPCAEAAAPPRRKGQSFAAALGGRRLMLRLTSRCDGVCARCAMADLAHLPDRSFASAARALEGGRRAGCSELVIMRGEASLWPDLARLLRRARSLGFGFIQMQTSGRPLARKAVRRELFPLIEAVEVTVYAADAATHDALTGSPGSLREALVGARAAVAAGLELIVHTPVLRRNLRGLEGAALLAARLGARRVQFDFARPIETPRGVDAAELARLSDASPFIARALTAAARAGIVASTEGVPFCHLEPAWRRGPDVEEDWRRFRIDDLDHLEESLDARREDSRPEAPDCRACTARAACPRTWALYLALFGSSELSRLTGFRVASGASLTPSKKS